jgi:hypothetical protein
VGVRPVLAQQCACEQRTQHKSTAVQRTIAQATAMTIAMKGSTNKD